MQVLRGAYRSTEAELATDCHHFKVLLTHAVGKFNMLVLILDLTVDLFFFRYWLKEFSKFNFWMG